MFKLYLFANAVKLRQGKIVELPSRKNHWSNAEKVLDRQMWWFAGKIFVEAWVNLVNEYSKRVYSEYNVPHMLSEYVNGEIKISSPLEYPDFSYKFEDIGIYSRVAARRVFGSKHLMLARKPLYVNLENPKYNLFRAAILQDNVVFEKASLWYLTYKNKLVAIETLFSSGNEVFRSSVGKPGMGRVIPYVCLGLAKFAATKFGCTSLYRIQPKTSKGMQHCIEGLVELPSGIPMVEEDVGGGYIKYSISGSWLRNVTWRKLKSRCLRG